MALVRPAVAPASLPRHASTRRRRVASLASMPHRGSRSRGTAALDPSALGRGPVLCSKSEPVRAIAISDDVRLFAHTFLAGFVSVSVLIG